MLRYTLITWLIPTFPFCILRGQKELNLPVKRGGGSIMLSVILGFLVVRLKNAQSMNKVLSPWSLLAQGVCQHGLWTRVNLSFHRRTSCRDVSESPELDSFCPRPNAASEAKWVLQHFWPLSRKKSIWTALHLALRKSKELWVGIPWDHFTVVAQNKNVRLPHTEESWIIQKALYIFDHVLFSAINAELSKPTSYVHFSNEWSTI